MDALATVAAAPITRLESLRDSARECFDRAVPETTRNAYQADWRHFSTFCEGLGVSPLQETPKHASELVALFVASMAERRMATATIRRRVAGVGKCYRDAGLPSPTLHETVKRAIKGAVRLQAEKGLRPRPARGLRPGEVRAMLATCDPHTNKGKRDSAALALAYVCFSRRSEIPPLNLDDLTINDEGAAVLIARQKNRADPMTKYVPRGGQPCPVSLFERWCEVSARVNAGPLFLHIDRHDNPLPNRLSISGYDALFARARDKAGLSADRVTTHSMRRGGAQQAARNGFDLTAVQEHGGWKSIQQVSEYARSGLAFDTSAARGLLDQE
jgi:integrase